MSFRLHLSAAFPLMAAFLICAGAAAEPPGSKESPEALLKKATQLLAQPMARSSCPD